MQQHEDGSFIELIRVDFSENCEQKEDIKQTLLQALEIQNKEEEKLTMKNKSKIKNPRRIAIIAMVSLIALSGTAFAVIKNVNLGKYATYEANEISSRDEAQAAVAEENEMITQNTSSSDMDDIDSYSKRFETLEEVQKYLMFTVNMPTYIPAGYTLEGYRLFTNDQGEIDAEGKYLSLDFYNDVNPKKYIYMQVRYMDEETAFATGYSSDMKKTTIDGHEAVIGKGTIDILIDDVLYMISGNAKLSENELIAIAESIGSNI